MDLFIWQICLQKQRTIGRDIHYYHIEQSAELTLEIVKWSVISDASVEMNILLKRGLCKII